MKIFNGVRWDNGSWDTGWRNITSLTDLSVIPYYYRNAPRDDELYQIEPGEVIIECFIRRKDFKVTLIIDVTFVDDDFAAKQGTVFAPGGDNPLSVIGLPTDTVASRDIITYTGFTPTNSKTNIAEDKFAVCGEGMNTIPERAGEVKWIGKTYMSLGRYIVKWVTSDPFPQNLPGLAE